MLAEYCFPNVEAEETNPIDENNSVRRRTGLHDLLQEAMRVEYGMLCEQVDGPWATHLSR